MTAVRRFSARVLAHLDESSYLKIRAGSDHRFIGIWVVVVNGRVFVRSWNDKPEGWYRAFLDEPRGAILIGEREIPILAKRATTERIMAAVEAAYAVKYTTAARATTCSASNGRAGVRRPRSSYRASLVRRPYGNSSAKNSLTIRRSGSIVFSQSASLVHRSP